MPVLLHAPAGLGFALGGLTALNHVLLYKNNAIPSLISLETLSFVQNLDLRLVDRCGRLFDLQTWLQSTTDDNIPIIDLYLTCRLRGGKGGFGSQLRQGGRLRRRPKRALDPTLIGTTQDPELFACRDLSGRRIRTLAQAQALSTLEQTEQAKQRQEMEKKLAELDEKQKAAEIVLERVRGERSGRVSDAYVKQSQTLLDQVTVAVERGMQQSQDESQINTTFLGNDWELDLLEESENESEKKRLK